MKNKQSTFPLFYSKLTAFMSLVPPVSPVIFNHYSLGQENFAKLMDPVFFSEIRSAVVEVDIHQECQRMQEDHLLEISVPVLALNDVMGQTRDLPSFILHPLLVAVNGLGARIQGSKDHFPHVDFINVVDIADNRYEIIVTPEGKLELPEEGLGLFTTIKEIIYILSFRQVKEGQGLENMRIVGACSEKLYLYPPPDVKESFVCYVSLVHFDAQYRRIVDSIRRVLISFSPLPDDRIPLELLYTEYEFMRDFLQKKVLSFPSEREYNNFVLRPETFSRLYRQFLHDVAHGYIAKEVLLALTNHPPSLSH